MIAVYEVMMSRKQKRKAVYGISGIATKSLLSVVDSITFFQDILLSIALSLLTSVNFALKIKRNAR